MTVLNIQLNLPDNLVQEAKKHGLLDAQAIENLLQNELKRCRVNELLAIADRLVIYDIDPLTGTEIAEEIQAVRNNK